MPESNDGIEKYLMEGCGVFHPSAMVRADVLKKYAVKYESDFTPAEDYALWCRLIGKTKFHNIQKVLMKYRWHKTNTSKLQNDKRLLAVKAIHNLLKKEQPKLWEKVHHSGSYIVRGKLFGVLPILKMKQLSDKKPKFLKYLPFIKIKIKLEVK